MSTKMGRTDIRKCFRERYDLYCRTLTLPYAVDQWRSDNRTTDTLFSREMRETISGAVYPTQAELDESRRQHAIWVREKERDKQRRFLRGSVIDGFADGAE